MKFSFMFLVKTVSLVPYSGMQKELTFLRLPGIPLSFTGEVKHAGLSWKKESLTCITEIPYSHDEL